MDMNMEVNRRRTFAVSLWPRNAPVAAEQLAKHGFFATANFLETQCQFCHKIVSDWQYNDLVPVRHRRLCPSCPIIVHSNTCGNIPLTNRLEQAEPAAEVDLKNEMSRLATFKNWPNPNISPASLAKAGFYYINFSDQVKCAWCKGVIARWEKNDNAFEEHKRFFPDCPRVQLGPLVEIASDGIRELGIQHICAPKKPKYACLDARIRTYSTWPIPEIQNPEILSQAGFYYQEIDDQVRCFHCNGGLRSWQGEDDPWFEHAKWFPHCQFLKLVKGIAYVTQVQQTEHHAGTHETNPREALAENVEPVTTLDAAMASAPVRRALEMGLNEGRILMATRRQLEYCGKPFETTEELVEAVLEGQVDEEDDDGNEPSSSIVREVSRLLNTIFSDDVGDFDDDIQNHEDNTPAPNFSHNHYNMGNGIEVAASAPPLPTSISPSTLATHPLQRDDAICIVTNNSQTRSQPLVTFATAGYSLNQYTNADSATTDSLVTAPTIFFNNSNTNAENDGSKIEKIVSQQPQANSTENNLNGKSSSTSSIASCSAASVPGHPPSISKQISLEEENRKLKDARQCKICMDDEVAVVFLPCGHLVTCVQCAPGVNNCPLCRSPIKGCVRTFMS